MTIWEIDRALESLVDEETGELLDYEAFAQLQMDRDAKIENTVLWYKNLVSDVAEMKAAENDLKERRQKKERMAERLKKIVEEALCGEKFETARCAVTYRKSSALETGDGLAEWLRENGHFDLLVEQAPKIDKRGVTELIKSGVAVPGAEIVERQNMSIK